ncbi:maf protein [Chlorobium phaeobacteroides DSM 266]|uniref:dTTP/UTP pyrophosphatase n=2 Tax=Chlorobium phaeobacteroides TaxID=1096 RepID=A1BFE6_CHLPD|nr:maf protein [Chlorobium phaeobacteroides DSM 266]
MNLAMEKPLLILASQSPRRKEILSLMRHTFEIIPVDTPENLNARLTVEENVALIALEKAKAAEPYRTKKDAIIIGADTVVAHENRILGKPSSFDEAWAMLAKLQNATHKVHTGFALLSELKQHTECVTTTVTIAPMSSREITYYITEMKPFDKAGAYGIQDPLMACYIQRIEGCYYNVAGLPLSRVHSVLHSHFFAEK